METGRSGIDPAMIGKHFLASLHFRGPEHVMRGGKAGNGRMSNDIRIPFQKRYQSLACKPWNQNAQDRNAADVHTYPKHHLRHTNTWGRWSEGTTKCRGMADDDIAPPPPAPPPFEKALKTVHHTLQWPDRRGQITETIRSYQRDPN